MFCESIERISKISLWLDIVIACTSIHVIAKVIDKFKGSGII